MIMQSLINSEKLCLNPNSENGSDVTCADNIIINKSNRSITNDENDSSSSENTTSIKKCGWNKDSRTPSSCTYTSSDCLDDCQENISFTVKMITNNSDTTPGETEEGKTELSTYIPQIVSFESPMRKRRPSSEYSVSSNTSEPDICSSDIDPDTDISRDFDSDTQTTSTRSRQRIPSEKPQSGTPNEDALINAHSQTKDSTSTKQPPLNQCKNKKERGSFLNFRLQYLIVHMAIMLADGLQGTHLYVLYEGYGYSPSSLYSLGFVSGALTSPFIGPVVDNIGRKRAAMIYCILEIIINYFEQYPIFVGLLTSRILGGITTNLLFSVFESWLVTEHRKRGFEEDKLEIILRDSTIVSNSAAIIAGYLAHRLADSFGPVGPFEGAVVLTAVALALVWLVWQENYGNASKSNEELMTWRGNLVGAYHTIVGDSNISRIGIIQGLTEGALQTFVFLWAPALRAFATSAPEGTWGVDKNDEPAYGLIFGSFMAFGVIGGFLEPTVRKAMNLVLSLGSHRTTDNSEETDEKDGEVNPTSVHSLCALCYFTSSMLLLTPCILNLENKYAFSLCFAAFLMYELMIGLYMPCEGIVRSIYMPNDSICSLMTMLRVIVNVAVAAGVISTNFIPFTLAFGVLSTMMITSACLQLSLIESNEFRNSFSFFKGLNKEKVH